MKIHLTRLLFLLCLTAIANDAYSQLQSLCITGYEDGHAYVDLGLPSKKKWATENLSGYDGNDRFDAADRVAYNYWSSKYETGFYRHGWSEPSREDFEELIEKCTWEWTSYKNKEGMKGTGPNGNYIFFPANFHDVITRGYYWTKTHSPGFGIEFYVMTFNDYFRNKPGILLEKGDKRFNVRPVF